jgi:hypothetical protein
MRKLFAISFLLTPLALHAIGPALTRLEPPGGQAGAAVRLEIVGAGLSGDMKIVGDVPGAFTPLTVEKDGDQRRQYLLEIDKGARTGVYPLRIETSEGLSNILLFTVGSFQEQAEEEALVDEQIPLNDTPEKAEPLELPKTVNGTLRGPDRDIYRLQGKKGQRIDLEVEARRIGSAIDPVLELRDAQGKLLERNNDAAGIHADSRLSLTLPVDGDYFVSVQDARFSEQRLDFYRLKAGRFTYAEAAFPLSGKRGQALEIELLGGNLSAMQKVTIPATDASWTQVQPQGEAVSLPFPVALTEEAHAFEPASKGPHALEPDVVMNGRVNAAGEVDLYRLAVRAGESWMIETRAGETGLSKLYALLTVADQDSKKLASAGDQEPETPLSNIVSNSDSPGDPYIAVTVPEGVTALEIGIEDLLGRGGPEYGYQIIARRQPPDFTLTLNDPYINLPRGGVAQVDVTLNRRGFDGAVKVHVENAPEGVTVEGGHIPAEFGGMTTRRDSRRGMFVLTASKEAEPRPFALEVWGEATLPDGTVVRRRAQSPGMIAGVAGRGQRAVSMPWLTEALPARIGEELPASLELVSPKRIRLIQGMVHNIEWEFRSEGDNIRPVDTVKVGALPIVGNIRVLGEAIVKKGQTKGLFELYTTMGTPEMTFDLTLSADAMVNGRRQTIYSPMMLFEIVQGYSIEAPAEPVRIEPNGTAVISGAFRRDPEFGSVVKLKATNLPLNVECNEVELARDATAYSLTCKAGANVEAGEYPVELAATSYLAGRDTQQTPYNIPPVTAPLTVKGSALAAER